MHNKKNNSKSSPFPERESLAMLASREERLLLALDGIMERRTWRQQQLREFQLSSLKDLLAHAFETVPFYREKYMAAGFRPADLISLDDLWRIPILTKNELRNVESDHLKSARSEGAARLLSSSGSTGIPSRMWRDEDSLWLFTAYNLVWYYDWCKRQPIGHVLYFVDLAPDAIDCAVADFLRTTVSAERLISVSEPTEHLIEKIEEFQPEFISSYPSTLRNIAIALRERNETYDRLRLVHLTSEMLDQRTRTLLAQVFPRAQVVESYTSTEAGLVAYPCPDDGRLHLTEDSGIYEILDDAGHPTDGQGRIVVTDLTNRSTPIIRYEGLGDFCRWAKSDCACGSSFRAIAHLEGRVSESLVLVDGTLLSPFNLLNETEEIKGIYQYQIIQHAVDLFEVLVVPDEIGRTREPDISSAIQNLFARVTGQKNPCHVEIVERIAPKEGAHKVPLVISYVGRTT